jgi:transporter family-2 protein
MLVMLAIPLASPGPRLPVSLAEGASWMSWTGGLFGAIFIGIAILTIPSLGAATVLSLWDRCLVRSRLTTFAADSR